MSAAISLFTSERLALVLVRLNNLVWMFVEVNRGVLLVLLLSADENALIRFLMGDWGLFQVRTYCSHHVISTGVACYLSSSALSVTAPWHSLKAGNPSCNDRKTNNTLPTVLMAMLSSVNFGLFYV